MVHCLTWIQEFWSMFPFAMERDNSEGWSEEDTKNEKKSPHSCDIVNEIIDPRKFESELVEEIDFRKCKSDENKNLPCDDILEYIDLSKYKTFSECRPWESTYKGRNAGNESRPESSFRSRNGSNDGFENLDSRELANRICYAPHKDIRKFKNNEDKILPFDDIFEKIDRRKHQPNDEQHSTFGEWASWGSTYSAKNARNKARLGPSCISRNEGGSDGSNNLDSKELSNRIRYVPQKDLKGFKRYEDEILSCDDIREKIDLTKYNPNVEQHSTLGEWCSWESTYNGRNARNKSRVEPSFRSRTEGGNDGFENLDSRELAKRIKSAPRKDVFDRFNYGRNAGSEPRVEGMRSRNERGSDGYENLDSKELANRLKYAPVKNVFDRSSYAYNVEVLDTKEFRNKTAHIPSKLDVDRGLDSAYTARKRRLPRFEQSFSTRSTSRISGSPWGWSMTPWGLNCSLQYTF